MENRPDSLNSGGINTTNLLRDLIKGKGKVVPVLNEAPRHEDVLGEWRYSSTYSLTSALDEDDWSASRPGRFTPRERAPNGKRVIN
jgi:hypothetical protein